MSTRLIAEYIEKVCANKLGILEMFENISMKFHIDVLLCLLTLLCFAWVWGIHLFAFL